MELEFKFETYTSASLPSGIYLFFPALGGPKRAPSADVLERVVLSTSFEGNWREPFSGIVVGNALHVDLEPQAFLALLAELTRNRDYRRNPIIFNATLDDEGCLREFEIGPRELERPRQTESGPPAPLDTDRAKTYR